MAKRPRKPLENIPPKIRHAVEKPSAKDSTNGATLAERDLTKYLDDERTVAEPAPAANAPDPAIQRGPVPSLDFHHEAWERLRESGACLRAVLQDQPMAIELLTDCEEEVVKRTVGRGVLERAAIEAGKLAKRERERKSAAKVRIPYPSVSEAEFTYLGKTPGYAE
jgi:hypothetical protein